ncbi:MAG: glycosyltransferase family 2 protein [Cytophagales bacterium]|nr:glycosyltransferase family 2 protein [Cytophagales bacterium]
MSTFPLVSIITVNYNGADLTALMIASLKKITYPNIEIIVVDNASKESPHFLKEQFPEIELIISPTNLGFAGGNNLGIKASKGKYIFLLNNDTEVDTGFLEPLVNKLESSHLVGAVSPKVYYFDTNIIQYAGATPIHPFTGRGGFIGEKEEDLGQYNTPSVSNHTHGAAMLVPRTVIEQIGLMSEYFFLYYEELDFCEKIKRAGYTIWYIPDSVVYHKESMSVGKKSTLKTFYMTRNRILFMKRNFPTSRYLLFLAFFTFISIPKNIFSYVLHKEWSLLWAFLKGFTWHLSPHKIPSDPRL